QPQGHAHRYHGQRPQPRLAGTVQAAEVPEGQGAQGGVVGDVGEQPDDGPGQGGQRYPGQQHGSDLGLAVQPPQSVDQRGDQQPPGKGGGGQHVRLQGQRQSQPARQPDNHQRRPQCRAAGDADQPWIGQRVAEQPLHGYLGQRQHGADHQPQQGTRQTDLADDQLGLGLGVGQVDADRPEQCPQGIGQRQADRPQRQRQPDRQQQQANQDRKSVV